MSKNISRRNFLKSAVAGAAGVTAMSLVGSVNAAADAAESLPPVTTELPIPEVAAPEVTQYVCDILVVGSGYAGMAAAAEAKAAGKNVLMVDKGHPGYSGASPFPQCYQFFDAKYGDSAEAQIAGTRANSEYLANLDWYNVYLEESRSCFDQFVEWGCYERYPNASEVSDEKGDYYTTNRTQEYYDKYVFPFDRRVAFNKMLKDKGIPTVDHTMLINAIKQDGKIVGALGLHVPSGTPITFRTKAIILCTGGGVYKNGGWPCGGDTFDGEWIAYQNGGMVSGKEFSYHMKTGPIAPSNCWHYYSWGYMENIHATASPFTAENIESKIAAGSSTMKTVLSEIENGVDVIDENTYSKQGLSNASWTNDPEGDARFTGNDVDPMPKRHAPGATIGKGIHKCDGVFCGIDDLVGYTGVPGLYAAGDSLASMIYGSVYTAGQGGSLPVSHIQGRRAAKAAAEYVDGVDLPELDQGIVNSMCEEVFAPLSREKGYTPYWVQDALMSIMAPAWVNFNKDEASLTNALNAVLKIRDTVLPRLTAKNSHELRVCQEAIHKVLSAELKLRLSLARKESRGLHYRSDYPYRDDANFLCYLAAKKGENGEVVIEKFDLKDEWKGDLSMPYEQRYPVRLPGEAEALGLEA